MACKRNLTLIKTIKESSRVDKVVEKNEGVVSSGLDLECVGGVDKARIGE